MDGLLKLEIIGVSDPQKLACIARARTYKQYRKMVDDALAYRCPFCDIDREHNRVIAENDCWYAWKCNPPEKNTRLHFLFVPKRHVTQTTELFADERSKLFGLIAVVRGIYEYTSSGILIRDGDATMSAGTIQHLHVHEMVPDGTGRVESPFYKGKDAEEASLRRAIIFEKMRRFSILTGRTEPVELCSNLSEVEIALVADRLN